MEKKDRFLGCLVGLSVGDAYGTTYEFTDKDKMPSVDLLPDEIVGGGPFNMKPGEWTDDTSMALCLAESLIEKGWNAPDQMNRYIKWWQEGYNSVKGECFDIGGATRNALSTFNMTGDYHYDTQAAGNGVLMRLAPVPMYFHGNFKDVIEHSHTQSIITHSSPQSVECTMLMGVIIDKILSGEKDKNKILDFNQLLTEEQHDFFKAVAKLQVPHVENKKIEDIKQMKYKDLDEKFLEGDGYCVLTLEAALWAFYTTDNFKDGLKKVVSLGSDTDTTGAVYGQIAGAYYGINGIPWVEKIAWIDKIKNLAENLYKINEKQQYKNQ